MICNSLKLTYSVKAITTFSEEFETFSLQGILRRLDERGLEVTAICIVSSYFVERLPAITKTSFNVYN